MCGSGPWDALGHAKELAGRAAAFAGLTTVANRLRRTPAVRLVALRPSADSSTWARGSQRGRPAFYHAVNADFDLGSTVNDSSVDGRLGRLAIWVNAVQLDSTASAAGKQREPQVLHVSSAFPPPLREDNEQGAVEYMKDRCVADAHIIARCGQHTCSFHF